MKYGFSSFHVPISKIPKFGVLNRGKVLNLISYFIV
jgi:hypothetical protein